MNEAIIAVNRLTAAISEHASFVIRYPARSPNRRVVVEEAAARILLRILLGREPIQEEIKAALDYPRDPLTVSERRPNSEAQIAIELMPQASVPGIS